MKTNTLKLLFGVFAISFSIFTHPQIAADDINVTSVTGTWENVVGGPEPVFSNNVNGVDTNFMQWGVPANAANGQSAYKFVGAAPPTMSNLPLDQPFLLGTYYHYNFTITNNGGSLTSTDLAISLAFNINGQNFNYNTMYSFNHNETPNVNFNLSNPINNDIVTIGNDHTQQHVININGVDYVLTLMGFSTSPGGPLVTQFSTVEGQINAAQLYAEFTRADVQVPEPSTYMLLGGMLFVIALKQSKRRITA